MKIAKVLVAVLFVLNIGLVVMSQNMNPKKIQQEINRIRQVERIKSLILQNLSSNNATIELPPLVGNRYGGSNNIQNYNQFSKLSTDELQKLGNTLRAKPKPSPVKPESSKKTLVILGSPASIKKDGCFNFQMKKYMSGEDEIYPVGVSLYVHIILKSDRKRNKNKRNDKSITNVQTRRASRTRRSRGRRDRKKNRKGKRNKGKTIKLFVSNGEKRLAKMRMRVNVTKWYGPIELPISRFPTVISLNDTFKLCIECKRCKKKVKLNLYKKNRSTKKGNSRQRPIIPFIHLETRSHPLLPQPIKRNKRSNDDVVKNKVELSRQTINDVIYNSNTAPCCREEVYTQDIISIFPSIISPLAVNISFCDDTRVSSEQTLDTLEKGRLTSNKHLPLQLGDAQKEVCKTNTMKAFTYSFMDKQLNIRYASIPNLIPTGCRCGES